MIKNTGIRDRGSDNRRPQYDLPDLRGKQGSDDPRGIGFAFHRASRNQRSDDRGQAVANRFRLIPRTLNPEP